jgi:hypothetical protein
LADDFLTIINIFLAKQDGHYTAENCKKGKPINTTTTQDENKWSRDNQQVEVVMWQERPRRISWLALEYSTDGSIFPGYPYDFRGRLLQYENISNWKLQFHMQITFSFFLLFFEQPGSFLPFWTRIPKTYLLKPIYYFLVEIL